MICTRNVLSAFALTLGLSFTASAQTWSGGGGDDNWNTGGNWSGAAAPFSDISTSLTFAGTARLTPFNDITDPFTLNTLTFAAGAGAFNLDGSPLFVDGAMRSILSNTASNVSFAQNVTYGGNGTINAAGGGGITFGGSLIVSQGTTMVLSNNVTVNDLRLGSDGAASIFDTGTRIVAITGAVDYDGTGVTGAVGEIRGTLDLNDGVRAFTASIGTGIAYDLIVAAQLTGSGSSGITVPDCDGNLLFAGQSNYAGTTFFNNPNGAIYLGANNALPTTSPVTLGNRTYLSLRTPASQGSVVAADYNHQFASLASSFANAQVVFGNTSTLTVGDTTTRTYAGIFSQSTSAGAPTLAKTGTGTWILSGNSSPTPAVGGVAFRGSVIVDQGKLMVNTVPGTTTITISPGVTETTSNSGTGRATVLVHANGILAGTGAIVPRQGSQAANTITVNGTIAPESLTSGYGNLRLGGTTDKATVTINGTYAVNLSLTDNDRLTINGSLTLGGNSTLNASGIASMPGGSTILSYVIATFDDAALTGTFTNLSIPAGSSIQYNADNITLLVPVPEPGTVLGLTAGLLTCGAWIRRRMTWL